MTRPNNEERLRGLVIAAPRKYHGLGNRVRAVLGARSLARYVRRNFAYTWPLGDRFGARFDELWTIGDRVVPELISRGLAVRYPYRSEDLAWVEDARRQRVWQIRTAHALHLPEGANPWGDELRSLSPAPPIAARIETFYQAYLQGNPYVGVMVRTHPISNRQTLEHSPIEWFVGRMREIAESRPGVRFFVSADTADGQRTILDAVPGSFALDEKGAYNSKAALLSSVVDLYLLAGSGHILAPYYSSFPELSQELAGPTLRLETSMTGRSERLEPDEPLLRAPDPLRPDHRRDA